MQHYYSGTSGLLLPVPNKQFYPEEFKSKSRLCYYASLMNSIEVNSSFYKIPQANTLSRWAADVPDDFRFTFKLFQGITHNKELFFDANVLSRFMATIAHVNDKKGCLLVQFPPSVRIQQLRQMERLMVLLRENDPLMEWKIALEFRHHSLYVTEIYDLLANYQFGMVIHDKKAVGSPHIETHPDFVFLRFHGPGGDYRDSYSDEVLHEYSNYIVEWLADNKKVFVYFNNTMGNAIQNLFTLKQMVNDSFL